MWLVIPWYSLFLFHRAEQRIFEFARQPSDFRYLGLRDLAGVYARYADSLIVNLEHNADRANFGMTEHVHQHEDDEVHRGVVVIMKQHLVERGLLKLPLGVGFYRFVVLWGVYRHNAGAILSYRGGRSNWQGSRLSVSITAFDTVELFE